ncbi:branched-chain amino acid ABC transporter permease [Hoeflea prorocentri]|uniref:Branched-chain amino acid ABC transporter permease n=1 Tax=Hoeflea prorocentri TaxID=1922333 RepID=A0A9X3UF22_9HYPH|nr:branched-chain amino acid ABC transporter permease [Hoeflea prorocentri]MCY6379354.1 branched-chain amino acid ABC transporter permease [Hoeflea prorocentri]MDA5397155.1 branched-chain amino acid ABC transporter permease [Hoeflea prorocentri]
MDHSTNKSRTTRGRYLALLTVLALAAVLATPLFVGVYSASLIRDALLFALLALALDFLWGKTGVLSFGHAAFFGAGAYGAAIISTRFGLDPALGSWAGLLAGILISATIALIVGYFLIFGGVRDSYFTIVTLALAVIADHVVTGWSSVTGGDAGILGIPPLHFPSSDGWAALSPLALYWFIAGIVSVVGFSVWWACRGRYGAVLKSIEDNEQRSQALGHNTSLHLLIVFVLSASIAALGGGLYASTVGFVAKDTIGLLLSTQAIIWVAIGGRGTLIGPVLATILVIWLEQEITSIDTKFWPLAMGGLFILAVFAFPDGILKTLERLFNRLRSSAEPKEAKGND